MEEKYIDIESRIHDYNNAAELKEAFGGHLEKRAVRIDDNTESLNRRQENSEITLKKTLKDSLIFGGLFRSLMSKNNNYFTYMNGSFEGKKKSEMHIPRFLSCFVKSARGNEYSDRKVKACFSECVGSRLANLLGVKTVYNIALQSKEPDEFDDEYPDYDTIVSVDYVPYGYTTETFDDLDIKFDEDTSLERIFKIIDMRFKHIAKEYHLDLSIDKLATLKREFAFQFLFRSLVCEDYDFCSYNTALLIGENGDFQLAPCFDMEFVFAGQKSALYYKKFATETVNFMLKVMPDVLKEFMAKYGHAVKSGQMEDIVNNTLKLKYRISGPIADRLTNNYDRLSHIISECQKNSEMADS